MDTMDDEKLKFLCRGLSNATGMPVRIFRGQKRATYYSVYQLLPDPANEDLPRILEISSPAGVISTELMQYYGFFLLPGGERLIIGPSRAESGSDRKLREQVCLLGVAQEAQGEYLRYLGCLPVYSMARMSWLISFLSTVSERREVPVEALFVNLQLEDPRDIHDFPNYKDGLSEETDDLILLDNGYRFEQMLLTFIQQGEPERARDLLAAPPSMLLGTLSSDVLRQARNEGICAATLASRAAIAGGVDSRTALRMSDVYIQQLELLRDPASVDRLYAKLIVDFAWEVRRVRYNISPQEGKGSIFTQCAEYVSQHIFSPIRAQEVADALGYTRSYLCTRFRELAGMTLTQYILQEKVFEAQRLLRFTDQSLSQLAALLAFSSQSHFQNVFKKQTGETPTQYRSRMR